MKTKLTETLESKLTEELDVTSHLTSHHDSSLGRADTRRTVEDLLEIRRYKELHEDVYDLE